MSNMTAQERINTLEGNDYIVTFDVVIRERTGTLAVRCSAIDRLGAEPISTEYAAADEALIAVYHRAIGRRNQQDERERHVLEGRVL